jgi:colanic acid biosynthesis glycosyl transferase WcaI
VLWYTQAIPSSESKVVSMRRPTVLFINRVYPPVRGATGRVLKDLARSFAQEGWHVTVLTTGPKAIQLRDGAVRIVCVKGPEKPKGALGYFWIWLKLLWAGLKMKPRHLVVTMSDPPLLIVAGRIIAYFKKARHINWCHDLYPEVMPALGFKLPGFIMGLFKNMSQHAMEHCDKVIVSGRCMAKHLSMDGISARRIAMIPNWPDMELVDPDAVAIPQQKFHNGTKAEGVRPYEDQMKEGLKFRVLYAGNIGLAHPIGTVLEAAEILQKESSDVEFVFVGEGPRYDYLAKQRMERGLNNIRLLPYQPASRLRELMESGDLHLISMHEDAAGFIVPSKLYAALAVARPCILIGPEQSEVAKVINDFSAGSVVPQGNAMLLAQTIAKYRVSGEAWFAAHSGAAQAGDVFRPQFSMEAWMEKAWDAVKSDLVA